MDAGIGRILGKLDDLGITDQTLVIFTSDNGYNMGHHGIHGKGNGTFPVNMYEESVKAPFITRRPGSVPAGVLNTDLVSHYDFMPTILDYAGVESPVRHDLPGQSFSGILRGDTGGNDAVVVCDEYGPVRMVREKAWKYVHRAKRPTWSTIPRFTARPAGCGSIWMTGSFVTSIRPATGPGSA